MFDFRKKRDFFLYHFFDFEKNQETILKRGRLNY